MEIHLKIIGLLLTSLAMIHLIFPKYFKWKQDLSGLMLINRQMMYVHAFFVALVVLLIGLLCIFCAKDLLNTPVGHKVSAGLFVFWFCRLVIQFTGYSSALWKGKTFETSIHVVFSLFWIYLSVIFFMTAFLSESV